MTQVPGKVIDEDIDNGGKETSHKQGKPEVYLLFHKSDWAIAWLPDSDGTFSECHAGDKPAGEPRLADRRTNFPALAVPAIFIFQEYPEQPHCLLKLAFFAASGQKIVAEGRKVRCAEVKY